MQSLYWLATWSSMRLVFSSDNSAAVLGLAGLTMIRCVATNAGWVDFGAAGTIVKTGNGLMYGDGATGAVVCLAESWKDRILKFGAMVWAVQAASPAIASPVTAG